MFRCKCIIFEVALVLSLLCITVKSAAYTSTVQTKNGALRGISLISRNGRHYEGFVGIRYGIVPERFQNSVPSSPWKGTKDAIEFGSLCPQILRTTRAVAGDEDCLFLNVYTPRADDSKRPVLVFIHGGAFLFGSGDMYGAKYFMDDDIVLVTLNYRVGMLGFLNMQNGEAPGNMGLKDQVLALKWVQENIQALGGDASKVTISGESAGAASVIHLLLSPTTRGLFHSAVAQSGSALNSWAFKESTLKSAFFAGNHLKCPNETSTELLACLKNKPFADLLGIEAIFEEWYHDPGIPFPPTLEIKDERNPEPFLPNSPRNLVKAGNFSQVPLLLTVNKDEGSLMHAAKIIRLPDYLENLNEYWDNAAPITFLFRDDPQLQGRDMIDIAHKVGKFYFDNQEITLEKEENLTNLYSDSWFVYGIHETAIEVSKFAPVYTALITHVRKDFSLLSSQGITENLGVITHAEELPYLFGPCDPECPNQNFLSWHPVVEHDDVEFSKGFVKLISSFVKTRIPEVTLGESPKFNPVTKEETESGQLNWLRLDLQPELLIQPLKERMTFWESIYNCKREDCSSSQGDSIRFSQYTLTVGFFLAFGLLHISIF